MANHERRIFIRTGGLALVSLGLDPWFLDRVAMASDGNARRSGKTLICIFQRGAVDGLNMLVPHGDPAYYANRDRIAIPRPGQDGGVIDLDGYFGLHPALASLLPLYDEGTLAPIHAVGSPDRTRSHFDAQDFMETGTPGVRSTRDGWINRQLAHARDHDATPFRGVAIGQRLPRSLRGTAPVLAVSNLDSFGVGGRGRSRGRLTRAFEELYSGAEGVIGNSSAEAFEAVRILRASEQAETSRRADYPATGFGRSMRQLARLIKMNVGLEIGFASVGGWDTHVNQGAALGQLANNLRQFGNTLRAFSDDLGDRMSDVVVLTMSEFGRTIAENGNGGTDHGHGTAMMVLGGNTSGGSIYGNWPTLAEERLFQGRDLAVTTDFRDLFSEVLVKHLGARNLSDVFPGHDNDVENWPGVIR